MRWKENWLLDVDAEISHVRKLKFFNFYINLLKKYRNFEYVVQNCDRIWWIMNKMFEIKVQYCEENVKVSSISTLEH